MSLLRHDTLSYSAASHVVDITIMNVVIKKTVADRTVVLKILSYLLRHK